MRPNIDCLTGLLADMFCPSPLFIQLSVASHLIELDGLFVRLLISCMWAEGRRGRMAMLESLSAPVRSIICLVSSPMSELPIILNTHLAT